MTTEPLNPREFEQFRSLIYRHSGIRIGERKISLLSNRIRRRVKAGGFDSFGTYYRYLTSTRSDQQEMEYFLDAITTNETFFFRTPAHYEWLNDSFLPEVAQAQSRGERSPSLRFWSAACADGAEAYSIAIAVLQHRCRFSRWQVTIHGTDISEQEIRKANIGQFNERDLESLSDRQRRTFFHANQDGTWQAEPAIRSLVQFRQHNLMAPSRIQCYDCIFLCNVLIYFDRQSKQQVLQNVIRALAPQGYLVVGPSEGVYDMLGTMQKVTPLVYQKVAASDSPSDHHPGSLNHG